MKKILCFIAATLMILGCGRSTSPIINNQGQEQLKTEVVADNQVNPQHSSIHPRNLFTISDAEKILGQPARLTDSASTIEDDVSKYKCAYTANFKDPKTGKTGFVDFLFEQYTHVASAQKVYSSIKTANENHQGVKELHDMGDEAYFHSDGQNFYFIMVRKGEKMFRMKVNKTTAVTSLDEFNLIAKKISVDL